MRRGVRSIGLNSIGATIAFHATLSKAFNPMKRQVVRIVLAMGAAHAVFIGRA